MLAAAVASVPFLAGQSTPITPVIVHAATSPAPLPGTVQAEDFDVGANGVAYRDTTSGNSGGQYRATDVDIETTSDTGGGYDLGWVFAGEWLNYTVSVAAAGTYDLEFRVASSDAGGTFHLEVNSTNVTGPLTVPNTGGWQTWTTIRKPAVSLSAGQQLWRLVMDTNGASTAVGNFNYFRAISASSSPYGGVATALPGTLEAENFDEGPSGVSFVDTTPQNSGGQYRSTAVDIEATVDTGSGYDVGWVFAGEWLKYSVTVATAGAYDLDFRVASAGAGGTFHLEVNGADVTGPLVAPNTGGWQTWTTLRKTGVTLSAGPQTWRLVMDANGSTTAIANFNYVGVTAGGGSTAYGGTPVALPGTIQAENFDQGAAGVAYLDNTTANSGGQYRSTGVDIEATSDSGGGYDVGWAFAGEWLNYSVTVATAGSYDIDVRVASGGAGGTFHIEVDGVDKTGPLAVPNTGSWQTWTTIQKPSVALSAGPQVFRLVMDTNGATTAVGNFNWIRVSVPNGLAILRGPYLQQVTDNSAIVVWTTRDLASAQVRYSASGGTPTSVNAIARLFPASNTGLSSDFYQYEAHIGGLSSATRYSYDVFMGGADATPGQDSMTTAPGTGTGSVRFIAFGDSGIGSISQSQLAARIAADTFDLALHTGDVAYGSSTAVGGPSYTQYDNWLFGVYSQWMRSRPFYPSIGNHDDEINHASAYRDVFVLPDQGASTTYPDNAERYYSFDYGPVHFVALDTEYALLDPGRQQAQLAWLDADLAATPQPWRVVYFHRSPYSSGADHGSMLDVRQAFSPILERRGVQLVLSGHDHDYERSIPWREFVATGSAITYIVSGGGGAPLYAVGTSSWTAKSASVNHYMRMTAGGCVMTVEAVGLDGAVFDQTSINRCAAANQPPLVTLTAPLAGASYLASSDVSISATATDDGSIARVEFYAGTALLNTDTSAPYTYTWSSVPAGSYDIRAIAYDDQGASATSAAATIALTATSSPPTGVAFQASPDHATLVNRYELRIYTSGANPSSAIALATSDLGKPPPDATGNITVDRSAFFSALTPGNYVAAIAAIGTGGSSTSAGVAFTR